MTKSLLCFGLLVFGLPGARAFSLFGPGPTYPGVPANLNGDAWEVTEIGFNPINNGGVPPWTIDSLLVGPKNLGEEYRRNTPVMYYACDASFLDFFGSNGVVAVDGAFAILNNAFTNNASNPARPNTNGVDGFSASLSEFPLQAAALNYQARAAGLQDVKSITLAMMMEQLGLADAVRYVWDIHDRFQPFGTTCPNSTEYTVVMRNFDIIASPLNQIQYSPYVNGVYYTYYISSDLCDQNGAPPSVDAVPLPTDPMSAFYTTPIASGNPYDLNSLLDGYYYTGLTRDDVAGLRYLLSANNRNYESPAPGSILLSSTGGGASGFGPAYVLYASNYTAFALSAKLTDPTTLSNLYPGLIVASSSNYPVVVQTPNLVLYFTNSLVLGNPPVLVIKTNGFTDSVVLNYVDTFANLFVTNSYPSGSNSLMAKYYSTNTKAQLVTITVQPSGVLGNGLVTNTTVKSILLTNVPSGDYFITTNLCGVNLLYQLTNYASVTATTNLVLMISNSLGYFVSQNLIIYSTNHAYWAEPIICAGGTTIVGVSNNAPALYQGIQKMQFVRANFDSLLGQYFQPITNSYSMVMITNYQAVNQTFQRIVTTPDFVIRAVDMSPGPAAGSAIIGYQVSRNIAFGFDTASTYSGLAGPGTINPSTTFLFNKVGPVWVNQSTFYMNGPVYGRSYILASFDGTTNDPVVYPNGTSIQNLENQILLQVYTTPTVLPVGTNGVPYLATFSATGGQPPYTWSVATNSAALPVGLNLDSGSGIVSGTPNDTTGTHDFTIELDDSGGRMVLMSYFITIQ